jgi:hypothetical protein
MRIRVVKTFKGEGMVEIWRADRDRGNLKF